jgi:hypothetical protein
MSKTGQESWVHGAAEPGFSQQGKEMGTQTGYRVVLVIIAQGWHFVFESELIF